MMWSYKKPTKPGLYYVNSGDVVTKETLHIVPMKIIGKDLCDSMLHLIDTYKSFYKFMPVDYEALNKIGNDDED